MPMPGPVLLLAVRRLSDQNASHLASLGDDRDQQHHSSMALGLKPAFNIPPDIAIVVLQPGDQNLIKLPAEPTVLARR